MNEIITEEIEVEQPEQSERRLATIRRIDAIDPIENSDFLELATVDGWRVVVSKKEGHKVGDLVVYCETDSFLPIWSEFAFLEKSSLRKMLTPEGSRTGYRLRTIKLRGTISEGLIIPLVKEYIDDDADPTWWLKIESQNLEVTVNEGDEVTDILKIIKWELPIHASLAGKAKGNFPHFLKKTDSERIENYFKYFKRDWYDHTWEVTTKLDGSSFTAYYHDGEFGVCSRNLDLIETEGNSFWIAARKNGLPEKMAAMAVEIGDFAVQGELCGPGCQSNSEGLLELDIFVFDIYDIAEHSKVAAGYRHDIVNALELKHVPYHGLMKFDHFESAKDFTDYAEGPSLNAAQREGLVFKSVNDPNINFKAISKSWLLASD